ncbi:MAG TPA: hypothetical protein VGK47_11390 [Nitrososphaeraceae archaeon]
MNLTATSFMPNKLEVWLVDRWKKEMGLDKAMKKVTQKIKTADRVLKEASKENVKLTKLDREVRDPKIKKCDKMMMSKKK